MKPLTITIGIPAHNEEHTLPPLLESIERQEGSSFVLEKIIITCDGCTDRTVPVVQHLAASNPRITLLNDGERKGKTLRMQELCDISESDILVTFDADIVLKENTILEKIALTFMQDSKATFVAIHQEPRHAHNFFSNVAAALNRIWDDTRLQFPNFDSIHNAYGAACAFKKEFAKGIKFPSPTICDAGYFYMKSKAKNGFRYIHDASITYLLPSTLADFLMQSKRSMVHDRESIRAYFGNEASLIYDVPLHYKLRALVQNLIRNPFLFACALWLAVYTRIGHHSDGVDELGFWQSPESTKMSQHE